MPFVRPALTTLVERIESDCSARLLDGQKPLRRSTIGVLARVLAGQTHLLYGYLEWLARQPFVDSAEAEYLERHALIWGITRKPAVCASGSVNIAITPGAVLPKGTELRRADGCLFHTTEDAWCASNSAEAIGNAQSLSQSSAVKCTVLVKALVAGASGNSANATPLTLTTPVAGVQGNATVVTLSSGLDAEDDASLRKRLLQRIQEPPQGGAAHDYAAWAREITGVGKAWVYPEYLGVGTVGVAITAEIDTADAESSPIPSDALLASVQQHIDAVRPITAQVTVFAPEALVVPITIRLVPHTEAAQQAVLLELRDLFLRESYPGACIRLSHLREAISLAPAEEDHTLLAPIADIVAEPYQMPLLGNVTFVSTENA